jgi:hypothetical protein
MSVDSSNSPTKTKWQMKAEKYLQSIEAIRSEFSSLLSNSSNSEESLAPELIQKLFRKAVSLHELEKIMNEAEMYDIYDKNEVYDKLVDFHIKTLDSVKAVKRSFPLKAQGSIKKVRQTANTVLCQGIKFKELEDLFVHLELNAKCEEVRNNQLSSQALNSLLQEIERCPGAVDNELVETFNVRKFMIDYANEKLSKLPKVEYLKDIDETSLRGLIADIKHHKMEIKKVNELESLVKISESIKKLYSYIISEEMIHQSLDQILVQLSNKLDQMANLLKNNKESFLNSFDEYSENCCREICQAIPGYVKECDLNDDQMLLGFCSKLRQLLWKSNSNRILERDDENEKTLENCIKDAPNTSSTEYALITERLHRIRTAKLTEKRTVEKITTFWNGSIKKLLSEADSVRDFLKESKIFFPDNALENQLEHLNEILNIFSHETINSEDLSRLTKEFECYKNVYPLLEEIKCLNSAADLAKMYKEKVEYTWKRSAKARQSLKDKRSLRDVQMIPRIDSKKALEYMKGFRRVDPKLMHEFSDSLEKVALALESLNTFSEKCNEYESQYSRATLLSMECTKGVIQGAFDKFDKLIEDYINLEVKEPAIELFLDQNELFLKAQALLKNISFPELRRDISSWESILQKVKKYGQLSKDIVRLMEAKMKMAEKLLMEAHKMRQFEFQATWGGKESQAKQAKMLTLEALQETLRSYEVGESEIELQDTMNYLEKVISSFNEYKTAIEKCTSLKGLEELRVNIQKLPLFVEDKVYQSIDSRIEGPSKLKAYFLKCLKDNSGKVIQEISEWRNKFDSLGVSVEEWEEFLQAYKEEQEFEANLSKIQWENTEIEQIKDLKAKYKQHRYIRNAEIECKILVAEIGSIQGVYERRLFGEEKPGRLFHGEELEDLANKCNSTLALIGNSDGELGKKLSFLKKFIQDINKFVEDRVKGSITLEELSLNLERNPFAEMVDLSKIVEEQQEKLNKEALKYGPSNVKVRQSYVNTIRLLLEKNPAFNNVPLDFAASAKGIEKAIYDRCINRAKNYDDYARNVFKILQRLAGFNAISSYLKDKTFDLNLIEKLFPKSKAEFQNIEDNIQMKNRNRDPNEDKKDQDNETAFNYFKIFNGTLFFGLRDGKTQKKVENAELFACCPLPLIRQFTAVPNKLLLSMNIKTEEFQKYVQKALLNENYVVMACWARFPQDSSTQARAYMEKNDLVASSQYCKSCKLFILPKVFVRPEWLKALDFYVAREDNEPIDFVCFTILKKVAVTEYTVPMAPQVMPFKENCTFYQVYSILNNVLERIVDPTVLLQQPKPPRSPPKENMISCEDNEVIVNNDYQDFFYSEDEMEDNNNLVIQDHFEEENRWDSQLNDWSSNGSQRGARDMGPIQGQGTLNFASNGLLGVLQPNSDAFGRKQYYDHPGQGQPHPQQGLLQKRPPKRTHYPEQEIQHNHPGMIDNQNNHFDMAQPYQSNTSNPMAQNEFNQKMFFKKPDHRGLPNNPYVKKQMNPQPQFRPPGNVNNPLNFGRPPSQNPVPHPGQGINSYKQGPYQALNQYSNSKHHNIPDDSSNFPSNYGSNSTVPAQSRYDIRITNNYNTQKHYDHPNYIEPIHINTSNQTGPLVVDRKIPVPGQMNHPAPSQPKQNQGNYGRGLLE